MVIADKVVKGKSTISVIVTYSHELQCKKCVFTTFEIW